MVRANQEAAGEIPPEQHSGDEFVIIMRGVCQDMITRNQEYMKEAARFQTTEMQNLYQPISFRDRETVRETIRQLKEMAAVEEKYASLEPVFARTRSRIEAKDWPRGSKRGFIKGMDNVLQRENQDRLALYTVERRWIDSTIELYAHVLDHFSSFSVRGHRIEIAEDEVRNTFNQKLSSATQLHDQYFQAVAQFEARQKSALAPYGVDPAELRPAEQ
jgi:hypothetical protein